MNIHTINGFSRYAFLSISPLICLVCSIYLYLLTEWFNTTDYVLMSCLYYLKPLICKLNSRFSRNVSYLWTLLICPVCSIYLQIELCSTPKKLSFHLILQVSSYTKPSSMAVDMSMTTINRWMFGYHFFTNHECILFYRKYNPLSSIRLICTIFLFITT